MAKKFKFIPPPPPDDEPLVSKDPEASFLTSVGYGAEKAATMGSADEFAGLGALINKTSEPAAEMPPWYPMTPGMSINSGVATTPKSEMLSAYEGEQGNYAKKEKAAYDANKAGYLLGELPLAAVQGVAAAPVLGPLEYGALAGMLNAEPGFENRVKGGVTGGAIGMAFGLAGEGVGNAIGAGINTTKATLTNRVPRALYQKIKDIVSRGGDPDALADEAGAAMNEARTVAGDMPLSVDNYQAVVKELQKNASNPLWKGAYKEENEAIEKLSELETSRKAGQYVTLTELANALEKIGRDVRGLPVGDPRRRVATIVRDALLKDLKANSEATPEEIETRVADFVAKKGAATKASNKPMPPVGTQDYEKSHYAMQDAVKKGTYKPKPYEGPSWAFEGPPQNEANAAMVKAREAYGKAMRQRELGDVAKQTEAQVPSYEEPMQDSTAFANLNDKLAKSDTPLKFNSPVDQQDWQQAVDLAIELQRTRWRPAAANTGGFANLGFATAAWNRFITYAKLPQILQDPQARAEFKALVNAGNSDPTVVTDMLGRLLTRVNIDEHDSDTLKAMPWLKAASAGSGI